MNLQALNTGASHDAPIRTAIYARVSTTDKGQDTENQLVQLREYAARQHYHVVHEYVDHATGKTGDRDAFKRLFEDASKRMFDVVVVWALDRFTREGVFETFAHIRKLAAYGVQFESYTEAHFRTTGPAGELTLAVSAWIARQERQRISDRTKAGLDRARRSGKHCGRPKKVFNRALAIELRAQGWSWNRISAELGGVPVKTIRRAVVSYGESISGSAEIHDGKHAVSVAPISDGETERIRHRKQTTI